MPIVPVSRRGWIVIAVVVLVVGVSIWGIRAGYAPQIGRFFASEPGYVPSCAWHGEEITPYAPQCCAGFEPVVVNLVPRLDARAIDNRTAQIAAEPLPGEELFACYPKIQQVPVGEAASFRVSPGTGPFFWTANDGQPSTGEGDRFSASFDTSGAHIVLVTSPGGGSSTCMVDAVGQGIPTVTPPALPTNSPTETPPPPSPLRTATYCVMPGCTAQLRQVQCIRAPCPPIVEFVCPSGVVPPPRPIVTPWPSVTQTPVPLEGISVGFGGSEAWTMEVPSTTQSHGVGLLMQPYPPSPTTGGAAITAIKLTVQYNPQYLEPMQPIGFDFEEILEPLTVRNISPDISEFTFTLGSGTTPAMVQFDVRPITLLFKPLKVGSAGPIAITDAIVTLPGRSDNAYRSDPSTNFGIIYAEVVSGPPVKPGDADGNGTVDIFDYNIVVSNFNRTGQGTPGDLDGNGTVDIFDYNLVVSNFNR